MARYHLNNPTELLAAYDFINRAKEQGFDIQLGKYYPQRSGKQNRLLHFYCAYFAHEYGITEVEAKEIYLKQYAAPFIFKVEKDIGGQTVVYYRSTADLNTAEMASAIKNFVSYANMHGIMLPDPDDDRSRRYCEQQMQSSNGWR